MFTGSTSHSLDAKGRLVLPRRYRDRLAQGLFVTKGQERCAYVYPKDTFHEAAQAMMAKLRSSSRNRALARVFFASAEEQRLDGQGRISVPPSIRGYAGLEGDVMVIGNGDRLELWSAAAWERYSADTEELFANLEEEEIPTNT